ncbi:MAG: hypothetical protein V5A72_02855, partial [Candidatus Nanohaloarchaea archaeon]
MNRLKEYNKGVSSVLVTLVVLSTLASGIAGYLLFLEDSKSNSSFDFPQGMNETSLNKFTRVILSHHSSLKNESSYTIETVNSADGGYNYTFRKEDSAIITNENRTNGDY